MAQNGTPKKVSKQEKIEQLVVAIYLGNTNFTKLAEKLNVSRRTAYRYWNEWKRSHELDHVDAKWWALENKLESDNPEKAFDGLTKIKLKAMKEQAEIDIKSVPKLKVEIVENRQPESDVSASPKTNDSA